MTGYGHYREECVHGLVGAQCRCPSRDKTVRRISCDVVRDHDERLASSTPAVAGLEARWVKATREGSCSFCNRVSDDVLAVSGGALTIRLCPICLHDVAALDGSPRL